MTTAELQAAKKREVEALRSRISSLPEGGNPEFWARLNRAERELMQIGFRRLREVSAH